MLFQDSQQVAQVSDQTCSRVPVTGTYELLLLTGHQCALRGSQMIVIGGLLATNVLADQPGIYVYDVSQSAWQSTYTSNSIVSTPISSCLFRTLSNYQSSNFFRLLLSVLDATNSRKHHWGNWDRKFIIWIWISIRRRWIK